MERTLSVLRLANACLKECLTAAVFIVMVAITFVAGYGALAWIFGVPFWAMVALAAVGLLAYVVLSELRRRSDVHERRTLARPRDRRI